MKKLLSVPILLLLICNLTPAGKKADFTAAEFFAPENLRKMVGTRNVTPIWIEGSENFFYKFSRKGKTEYILVDLKKRKKQPLFNHNKLSKKLTALSGTDTDPRKLNFSDTGYNRRTGIFEFTFHKKIYSYNIRNNRLRFSSEKEFLNNKI